jgi:hypothetical protein
LAEENSCEFATVWHMKNVYEVLRQKELELAKLEAEVEALRMVAPLLSNDDEGSDDHKAAAAGSTVQSRTKWMPQAMNAAPQPADVSPREDRIKNWP